MRFDPNFTLKGINGKELVGMEDNIHAGKVLASVLYYAQTGNQLKLHAWALKLYEKQPIEITKEDRDFLLNLIDNVKLPVITAGPIIQMLNELE
jgi:hypothetical protein